MTRTFHPISDADAATMTATREFLQSMPDMSMTPEARPFYDDMISQMPPADGVTFEAGNLGGVAGWWCRPDGATQHAVLLYLHGGGYILGSAAAYRNTVAQFATNAGVNAFALDYGLAPEHPFPSAVTDAVAAYDALVEHGFTRIAIAGDSAGGGLSLALLAIVSDRAVKPAAAVAVSPWADMSIAGESITSRAAADPILSGNKMTAAAATYLAGGDPLDPRASPVFGPLGNLPPVMIHVGDDEVLLDDSERYTARMEAAGGSVELHVWEGMLHVFTANIAMLESARRAMGRIGEFLATHLLPG